MEADSPHLQRLLERHGDLAARPLRAAIIGPGGSGKTELLARLSEGLAMAGVRVVPAAGGRASTTTPLAALAGLAGPGATDAPAAAEALSRRLRGRAALLVDDGHLLDPDSLLALVGLAERAALDGPGIVVAHRPARGSPALGWLDAALARWGPPLVLTPLGERDLARRAEARLGRPPRASIIEALALRSRGMPAVADRLLDGWSEAGIIEDGRLRGEPLAPPALVEGVRSNLDELGAPCRAVLLALEAGAAPTAEEVAMVAGIEEEAVGPAVEALQAAGLVLAGGEVVPAVGEAAERFVPPPERARTRRAMAARLRDRGAPLPEIAEQLAAADASGPEAVATFVDAGDSLLGEAADLALAWYDRALAAGGSPEALAARRGEALALGGDADAALRQVDRAAADPAAPDHRRALVVASALLGGFGRWARSTAACARLAGLSEGAEAATFRLLAVPGLVTLGRGEQARREAHEAAEALGPPATTLAEAALVTARGTLDALGSDIGGALHRLLQGAALLDAGRELRLLPDTPHALAALVAVLSLDLEPARVVLTRAVERSTGGPIVVPRHRLLLAWTELVAGRWGPVRDALHAVASAQLTPRDELVAAAIEVGLHRRAGDVAALRAALERAFRASLRHPADLFSVPFAGEILAGAGRTGQGERFAIWAAEMREMLDALGRPPLWETAHGWLRLQSAVAADDALAARVAAQDLRAIEALGSRLAALPRAATTWAAVLAGRVRAEEVRAAAADLGAAGLPWEATRLTGGAAIRARSPAVGRALLGHARELRLALPAPEGSVPAPALLSDRERQIASGVVAGLTHREIGAQLFISPKTVEHHVARIRQKLGAGTRAEMLAGLRQVLQEA